MSSPRNGFSLVEALVASLLMATAVAALAHLVGVGAAQGLSIRHHTTAIIAAQSKLDQLRSFVWTYRPNGDRLSDDVALALSPPRSLIEDHTGYVDHLTPTGGPCVGDCGVIAYVRRWSIFLLDQADADTLALQVCVFRVNASQAEACVSSIRTRRP